MALGTNDGEPGATPVPTGMGRRNIGYWAVKASHVGVSAGVGRSVPAEPPFWKDRG